MAESQDMSGDVTLMDIVAEVEEGDEFEIYAWECRVVRVVDCEARPWLEVQKKSVGGFMKRTYRLEWADPTDEDDETLAMKADRKHGWDVRFECDPSDVELENEPVATEASTDSEPVVMTDGGVDQSENETKRGTKTIEVPFDFWGLDVADELLDEDYENLRVSTAEVVGDRGNEQLIVELEADLNE